jgi:mono/diheme cytochrome c family protein
VRPVLLVVAACAGALAFALSGCGTGGYTSEGSQGAGKDLFAQRCGGCHALADAGTNGTIGPDLDDAFAQAREAGMTSDTFTQVVANQIKFPIENPVTEAPGMPAPTDGRSIFTANCASCHTLADAGTTGTVGPNLDDSRPSQELVVDRVTNGQGAMPAFKDSLDEQQIQAVAEYVAGAAGG